MFKIIDANKEISESLFSHNVVKIFFGNFSSVPWGSVKHFLKLINTHSLTQLFGNSFNIIYWDKSSSVIIESLLLNKEFLDKQGFCSFLSMKHNLLFEFCIFLLRSQCLYFFGSIQTYSCPLRRFLINKSIHVKIEKI